MSFKITLFVYVIGLRRIANIQNMYYSKKIPCVINFFLIFEQVYGLFEPKLLMKQTHPCFMDNPVK